MHAITLGEAETAEPGENVIAENGFKVLHRRHVVTAAVLGTEGALLAEFDGG